MKSGPRRVPLLPFSSFVDSLSKERETERKREKKKTRKIKHSGIYGFSMVCRWKTISKRDNHCSHPPFFRLYASTRAPSSFSSPFSFILLLFFFIIIILLFLLHRFFLAAAFILFHAKHLIRIYRRVRMLFLGRFRIGK